MYLVVIHYNFVVCILFEDTYLRSDLFSSYTLYSCCVYMIWSHVIRKILFLVVIHYDIDVFIFIWIYLIEKVLCLVVMHYKIIA